MKNAVFVNLPIVNRSRRSMYSRNQNPSSSWGASKNLIPGSEPRMSQRQKATSSRTMNSVKILWWELSLMDLTSHHPSKKSVFHLH